MACPSGSRGLPQAGRRRPLHPDGDRWVYRQSGSLSQHRADPGVDHLVGRVRDCVGIRRRSLGIAQPVAQLVRLDRPGLSRADWPQRSRLPPALSRGARRVAGGRIALRRVVDRAGVSEPRRAGQHRVAGSGVFTLDLGRHGGVRQRDLDQARRGVRDILRPLRPLRADRTLGWARPCIAAVRGGALGQCAGRRVDGRLRPPGAGERPL